MLIASVAVQQDHIDIFLIQERRDRPVTDTLSVMTPPHTPRKLILLALIASVAVAGCGRDADVERPQQSVTLQDTTPPGQENVASVVWGVNGELKSLDPLYTFDYPSTTAVTLMCESLLKTLPDGSIDAGLATLSEHSDTRMVLDINPAAHFWDGSPVTAEDVVFNLERQRQPNLGGFYIAAFDRVDTIEATGPLQVTINLLKPDYWLDGGLASRAGVIVQKKFVEERGESFATSSGGTMCTGAYSLKSWENSTEIVAQANPAYWNGEAPHVGEITMRSVPDEAALSSSMLTGEIDGTYRPASISTLNQLRESNVLDTYQGPGYNTDALIISNVDGTLGDVRVRRALSLAVDRQGIIDSVYKGAASMPRWISNPGTFGYAESVFEEAYDATPEWDRDLEEAKALVEEAGADGQTITIGMTNGLAQIAAAAGAWEAAGRAIGVKVQLKAVSTENFINFFIDPKAREGIDAFTTVDYGDYADPVSMVATIALPAGARNYAGIEDAQLIDLLERARETADPEDRAAIVVDIMERFNEVLPWIPLVQPATLLVMNKRLTGAVSSFAYMSSSWADDLGGR